MLPDPQVLDAVAAARTTLDDFNVGGRLQHIREFVWRGGNLRLRVGASGGVEQRLDVAYTLTAQWPAATFTRSVDTPGLLPVRGTAIDGRWVRAMRGYVLSVGVDLGVPSALYIRSPIFTSYVPVAGRAAEEVERRVHVELEEYVTRFLSRYPTVPDAEAQDRQELRRRGLLERA
jgi:hypothetical protein